MTVANFSYFHWNCTPALHINLEQVGPLNRSRHLRNSKNLKYFFYKTSSLVAVVVALAPEQGVLANHEGDGDESLTKQNVRYNSWYIS